MLLLPVVMSRKREEAIAAGIHVNDIQHTMKRRTPSHNYCDKGTYMLTLVVDGRMPLFGALKDDGRLPLFGPLKGDGRMPLSGPLKGDELVPSAAADAPRVVLSPLGEAIRDREIAKISAVYPMVEVWKLCIMPDHIHMIVRVKEDMPKGKHLGSIVAGFKGGCSRAWWRQKPCADAQGVVANADAQGMVAATTPAASAAGKEADNKRPSLFEGGYNDQILLEDGQLENWTHYLDDNPRRLAIKRLHPDYFTTMHHIDIDKWHCQTVGNRFLLDIPQKAAVIVHNAYTDKEYADYKQKWLAYGEAGGILVSAAIATREKEVMREAMNRGYRIILVRENGFPPLYKPSGEAFDACSDGRLLQVSPWEYHMQRCTISREQCLKLNRLVEDIVKYRRK